MTKIDKYYQITQNETLNISIYWKVAHILVICAATVCSFAATYTILKITSAFGKNCLIDAHLIFQDSSSFYHYKNVGNFSKNISFNNPYTSWGTPETCNMYQFAYLMICIVGLILFAFFAIVARGGAGVKGDMYMDPWKIVVPSICISIVICTISLILYIKVGVAINQFCGQFKNYISSKKCSEEINEYSLIYNKRKVNVSKYISLLDRFSSLAFLFWCLLVVTLVYRLVSGADFKIIVYHLKKSVKEDDADDTDDGSADSILENEKNPEASHIEIATVRKGKVKHEITWL